MAAPRPRRASLAARDAALSPHGLTPQVLAGAGFDGPALRTPAVVFRGGTGKLHLSPNCTDTVPAEVDLVDTPTTAYCARCTERSPTGRAATVAGHARRLLLAQAALTAAGAWPDPTPLVATLAQAMPATPTVADLDPTGAGDGPAPRTALLGTLRAHARAAAAAGEDVLAGPAAAVAAAVRALAAAWAAPVAAETALLGRLMARHLLAPQAATHWPGPARLPDGPATPALTPFERRTLWEAFRHGLADPQLPALDQVSERAVATARAAMPTHPPSLTLLRPTPHFPGTAFTTPQDWCAAEWAVAAEADLRALAGAWQARTAELLAQGGDRGTKVLFLTGYQPEQGASAALPGAILAPGVVTGPGELSAAPLTALEAAYLGAPGARLGGGLRAGAVLDAEPGEDEAVLALALQLAHQAEPGTPLTRPAPALAAARAVHR